MEKESENGVSELGLGGFVGEEGEKGDVEMDEQKGVDGLLMKEEGGVGMDVKNEGDGEGGVEDLCLGEGSSCVKECLEKVEGKVSVEMSERDEKGSDEGEEKGDVVMAQVDEKDSEVEEKVENLTENGGDDDGGEQCKKESGTGAKRGAKKKGAQLAQNDWEPRRSSRARVAVSYSEEIIFGDEGRSRQKKGGRRKETNGDGNLQIPKKEKGSTSSDDGHGHVEKKGKRQKFDPPVRGLVRDEQVLALESNYHLFGS